MGKKACVLVIAWDSQRTPKLALITARSERSPVLVSSSTNHRFHHFLSPEFQLTHEEAFPSIMSRKNIYPCWAHTLLALPALSTPEMLERNLAYHSPYLDNPS